MSSLSNKLQVWLTSNMNSNPRNKPSLYETKHAKALDLPGEWDVALIDISNLYSSTNLYKSYPYCVLK